MPKDYKRVLIIGIDGMDPNIAEPLMQKGVLPALQKLVRQGYYCRLPTTNPAQTPVAWTTIATGQNPGKHGIFDFIVRDPKTYKLRLSLFGLKQEITKDYPPQFESALKTKTFWERGSERGIPSTIVRWPLTFPPKPFSGRLLAGFGVPDLKTNLGRYTWFRTATTSAGWQGEIVRLAKGYKINTHLTLPQGIKIPLRLSRSRSSKDLTITLGEFSVVLQEKKWSSWIKFSVTLPKGKNLAGKCKFFLKSLNPELELYASAPEIDSQNPFFPISFPRDYAAELEQKIGPFHTLGMPEDVHAFQDGALSKEAFIELCAEIKNERQRMLFYELERFSEGILAVAFDTLDRIQHAFWQSDPALIKEWYRNLDSVIEKVFAACDPQTLIIVFSDHGFSHFSKAVHLNTWLLRGGYLALKKNLKEGRPLFQDIDWQRTKAYAAGFSSLYLNRRGREAHGIVGEAEAENLRQEIMKKLTEWLDLENGLPIFQRVYRSEELYRGPFMAEAPDLILGTKPGYRISWQTALGAVPKEILEENKKEWGGDHLVDPQFVPGVFFCSQPINSKTVKQVDIAPTILQALGIYDTKELEGISIL